MKYIDEDNTPGYLNRWEYIFAVVDEYRDGAAVVRILQ